LKKITYDEEDIKICLKNLYEIIQYSIPDVNYIKSPRIYEELSNTLLNISKNNKTEELKYLLLLAKKI
jgi:hypothetical protein